LRFGIFVAGSDLEVGEESGDISGIITGGDGGEVAVGADEVGGVGDEAGVRGGGRRGEFVEGKVVGVGGGVEGGGGAWAVGVELPVEGFEGGEVVGGVGRVGGNPGEAVASVERGLVDGATPQVRRGNERAIFVGDSC